MEQTTMAGAFDTVVDALKDAYSTFMKNPARLTLEFVKVVAMGMALQMALVLAITAIGMALGKEPGTDIMSLAAVAATLLLGLAFFIISSSLSATQFCIVDQMGEGKRVNIAAKAIELVPPMAAYCGIIIAAFIIVLGLAFASGTLLAGLAGAFLMLLTLVGMVAAVFLGQFAVTYIAVRKMDAIGALVSSVRLAKGNFWATFVFDVIMLVPVLAVIVILSLPQDIVSRIIASSGADAALTGAFFALSLFVSLIESTIVALIMTCFIYAFWKRLAGPEAPGAAAQEPAARPARVPRMQSKQ